MLFDKFYYTILENNDNNYKLQLGNISYKENLINIRFDLIIKFD